jgi:hypothetical protein
MSGSNVTFVRLEGTNVTLAAKRQAVPYPRSTCNRITSR